MSITKRVDSITLIPAERLKTVLPAPKAVKIEITGRCNYRCAFCALRARTAPAKPDMSMEFFKKITTEMHSAGVREVGVFYLGESFLAPELLLSCVQFLKRDLGIPYVFLTTNGSLAAPKIVAELMRSGLDSLKWSVNAGDPVQFNQITEVSPRMWEQSLINLKQAWYVRESLQAPCGIYASSILYDEEHRVRMEPLLEERVRPFVDEHYWLPLYSMGSVATVRVGELGWRPGPGNQGRIGALREPLPCWAVFTEGHVTSSGLLSACCFDADQSWVMADLNQVSFMDGWNSEAFQKLRAAHLALQVDNTACAKCIAMQTHK